MAGDLLKDLKRQVEEGIPQGVSVSFVEFEGPELVIYTEEPKKFADNGDIIRNLAKDLRKRIVVRPDPKVLVDPEEAIETIKRIVPEEGGVNDAYFDPDTGEVLIEADKPGLVIGKYGETLREISRNIGWTPRVVRVPPLPSATIKNIRSYLRAERDSRKEFLRRVGQKIHRDPTARDQWIRVTALGGCREVGRSSFMLSTPETKILIDCGVNVGSGNNISPYLYIPEVSPIDGIDAIVLTHAHLDHAGLVPLLFKYGYDGPVYTTAPTRDLMILLQLDYIDIASKEGSKIPYSSAMIRETLKHTIILNYGEVTDIAPDVKLTLHNAGHILGSAVAHFHIGQGVYNVAFTGDIKYERTLLFDPTVNNFPRIETLVMESTYGGNRDFQPSRQEAESKLQSSIKRTIERGGKVIIPAFAVGRSQEVMIVLEDAVRNEKLSRIPIYLDGMILEATAIHTAYPEYLNQNLRNLIFHKGLNPFLSDIFVQVDSPSKRREIIESDESCVILATSGMLNGGPVMEYLQDLSSDARNMLIFVGYQAEGTLGRRIQKGWKEIPFSSGGRTETIKINLEVVTNDGFSGHSDRNQLLNYVRRMRPQPSRILLNHGEEKKCLELANGIRKKFKAEVVVPKNLETVRLL
ncbi:MAG: beta-CASP ribonuclease aCPSF1 [Candidatus Syntrophoarchaeum sp.]|nr:beta-CASP ribonuclease aCPSF1 [Candidatus Syntrophoarchaeum sp.]